MLKLDHLAVAAETLDAGRAAVEQALGVALRPGGRHAHFGTHNMLLGLEDGLYLEVIAIDPEAPKPGYARWFDLDRFSGRPKLSNWICQTQDLKGTIAKLPQAGVPIALARGELRWQMAVPPDGILPFDGMFPALIEWQGQGHPAAKLTPSGCRLKRLVISHPEARELEAEIGPLMDAPLVEFESGAVGLRAEIATPGGLRVLE